MTSINKFRLSNIKYNDGKNFYDDTLIKCVDNNTYLDLINGVGKTFLSQMLLQPILPNAKFEEKKSINLLFNNKNNNKVIHSAIEFILDPGSAFKYALVGFCAYAREKKAEYSEDIKQQKFEMLRYICLYNSPNEYDIENIPYVKKDRDGRRTVLGATSLNKLLKELQNAHKSDYAVIINTKTKDHLAELAKLNINEIEYKEMIELNKYEGNAANYLKPYKKGKDFILKALIPIIEKSYTLRNIEEYETSENRADTLLRLKDILNKLQSKESLSSEYQFVCSELENVAEKIDMLEVVLNEREDLVLKLNRYSQSVDEAIISNTNLINELNENIEKYYDDIRILEEKIIEVQKKVEHVNINEYVIKLEEVKKSYDTAKEKRITKEKSINDTEDKILKFECEKLYVELLDLKKDLELNVEEIASLKKDQGDILKDYEFYGTNYLLKLEALKEECDKNFKKAKGKVQEVSDKISSSNRLSGSIEADIKNIKNVISNIENSIKELSSQIDEIRPHIYHLTKEDIVSQINVVSKDKITIENALALKKRGLEEAKIQKYELELSNQKVNNEIVNITSEIQRLSKFLEVFEEEYDNFKNIVGKYNSSDFSVVANVKEIISKINEDMTTTNREIETIENRLVDLKENKDITLSKEAKEQFEIISKEYSSAVLGSSFMANKGDDEKGKILNITSLIYYSVILSKQDFERIKNDTVIKRRFNDQIVPILNIDVLKLNEKVTYENVLFTNKDKSYFLDVEVRKKEIATLEKSLNKHKMTFKELEGQKEVLLNDLEELNSFVYKYNFEDVNAKKVLIKTFNEDKLKKDEELVNIISNMSANEILMENTSKELENLTDSIDCLSKSLENLEKELNNYILLEKISGEIKAKQIALREHKKDLEYKEENIYQLKQKILELRVSFETEKDKELSWLSKYNKTKFERDNLKFSIKVDVSLDENMTIEEAKGKFKIFDKNLSGKLRELEDLEEAGQKINIAISKTDKEILNKNTNAGVMIYTVGYFESNDLFTGDYDIQIALLSSQKRDLRDELIVCNKIENNLYGDAEKLSGNIEKAKQMFFETYKVTFEEYSFRYEEKESTLFKLDVEKRTLNQNKRELENNIYNSKIELIKTNKFKEQYENAKRTIEKVINKYNIVVTSVPLEKINIDFNEVLLFEREVININSSLNQRERLYNQTIDGMIYKLTSSQLVNFKEDLEIIKERMPKQTSECKVIKEAIVGPNGYIEQIKLEILRVSKEVVELKKDEDTFVSHCIQRCEQVYNELQSITHLSKVQINGKKRPLIEVILKTDEEEIRKAKMKNYISGLVASLSEIEDKQRLVYLSSKLRLEDLFIQYVSNINKCDVKVYKVETIQSQNEAYSWENIIGSTGQTNGMAYNVFIALISFIKKLYNPHIGEDSRKVLILDAPFSGMAASYIWEPIVKLLDENNFQLLCLGFEIPSNLLGIFEVKYYMNTESLNGISSVITENIESKVNLESSSYSKFTGEHIQEMMKGI